MDGKTFIPIIRLSRQLGIPVSWLKAEAAAGRIPCLRVGRHFRFNLEAVEAALLARATETRQAVPA